MRRLSAAGYACRENGTLASPLPEPENHDELFLPVYVVADFVDRVSDVLQCLVDFI
jgi:hypothetical protein